MGFYINPSNMTKPQWLDINAVCIHADEPPVKIHKDEIKLCLIDNGMFLALGIAYSKMEYEVFKSNDHRRKLWYRATTEDVEKVLGHKLPPGDRDGTW